MGKAENILHKVMHPTEHSRAHTGPHESGLANAADPRIDSDRDGSRNMGLRVDTKMHTGPHASQTANAMDPRVDSDRDGSANLGMAGGVGTTTGTTGTTGLGHGAGKAHVGPHTTGLANQLDPRVDSDLDGSRNMGLAQHSGMRK